MTIRTLKDTVTSRSKKPPKNHMNIQTSHYSWVSSVEDDGRGTQGWLRHRMCLAKGCSAQGDGAQSSAEKPERAETWASYPSLRSSGTLCLDFAPNTDLCISLAILTMLGFGHFHKASQFPSAISAAVPMASLRLRSTRTTFTWAPYYNFLPKAPSAEQINSFIPNTTSEKP